ncbi:MAG: LTA synthase family protein [Clostridiales bacterium]|nr:LTA synthase family protein [Clostridiales bacterium]
MKRFFSYFLFQTRPEETLTSRQRVVFWLWNALLTAGAAAALGLASLLLATGNASAKVMFMDYLRHPALVALNLLPPLLLMALLYAATGRAWLAYLITALPVLGLSLGNYYKLVFRDDPVLASDLLILGEAGNMAGKYHLFLDRKLAMALLPALMAGVALFLLARGRPRLPVRGGIAAAALIASLALIPVYGSDSIYNKNANADHINPWSATQQYISRGLMYPFLHSIKTAMPTPPEGYSEKEAAAMLAEYQDADIPEDKKVNIVGVMLEAFTDLSGYESIELQTDPYAYFHALEAESYTGNLLTNIFAGGTVDTERAFLTGMAPNDINYRSNTSSYVWYLKSQGYQTFGDHPSNRWFYNRVNINSYLGFDQYRFAEDHYKPLVGTDTAFDNVFFHEMTAAAVDRIENGDGPVFSFSVSYQGHGPYSDNICWWGEVDDYVANYDLTQEERTILANYFGSVMSTQYYVSEMVDVFRTMDEPIVVVVFGDHKPWLGNSNSVYNSLGIDLSRMSVDSFYNYWSTRYLIWANDAAKEVIGHDMVGEGPDISPCFLMNVLFEQLGWEGDAYMRAVEPIRQELPMVHRYGSYLTADGELTLDPTEEQAELARKLHNLEYYRAHHFSGETG